MLLCALTYFIILRIKRRAEKERHKRDFFRVYYFPKNSQLGRMGAIHGCMITQRQYDPNPSGKFVYTEKIRVKNIRYGPPIK